MIGHLDVAYGCAAFKEWGVHIFKDFVRTHTTHIYYKDGDKDGDKNADTSGRAKDSGQQEKSTTDLESEAADWKADWVVSSLWAQNARYRNHDMNVQHQVHATKARTRKWESGFRLLQE